MQPDIVEVAGLVQEILVVFERPNAIGSVVATGLDLLMGIVRWRYRVAVYVSLMRDEYPPFRLDLGSR